MNSSGALSIHFGIHVCVYTSAACSVRLKGVNVHAARGGDIFRQFHLPLTFRIQHLVFREGYANIRNVHPL
jgi:hypothetical protein